MIRPPPRSTPFPNTARFRSERRARPESALAVRRRAIAAAASALADGLGSAAVPIHVRAEPGEYADACLLPGDPLRAKYIAETFFDEPQQRNSERGMLGYTGTFEGKPVSVQATGMGCPSAAIVMEELVQLGVTRFLRVGTCGGLQPDMTLGDLVIAVTAVPADRTVEKLVNFEPHAPTADFGLVHAAVHAAKELDRPVRVGPIVSSDLDRKSVV